MDGARSMPPAAHAFAVPMEGIDGADRSVRTVPAPAAGTAALGRARLLARLLAQARVAAVKQPAAGAGSTLQRDRRVMHSDQVGTWVMEFDFYKLHLTEVSLYDRSISDVSASVRITTVQRRLRPKPDHVHAVND